MADNEIMLSGPNPFDRSYHAAQGAYDKAIIFLLCNIINASMHEIPSPLVTQLALYERNPNAWVIEQLVNGTADISSTTLVLTPESEKLVHYSIAVGTFRPQAFYKVDSIRTANNIYFLPFSIDTWLTFLCLLLTITVVLTFILARETKLPHNTPYDIIARIADEKHDEGIEWKLIDINKASEGTLQQRERWEIGEIFLVIVGAVCQQGSERDPSTVAARILLLALFILVVLMYTAFSASVISLISLLPNTNHEQHIEWAVAKNSQIILQDTNFFRYDFMVNEKQTAQYLPLNEGLKETVLGKAFFVGDRDTSTLTLHWLGITPDLRCSIGKSFLGIEYQRVFAIRSGSPHLSTINYNILRFRQFGLLSREKRHAFKDRQLCSAKERAALSGFVSVDWSDVQPAIQLISGGWTACIIVFLIEYFIYQCSNVIKSLFGKGWNERENAAENVLKNWLKARTIKQFKKNKKILLKPPEGQNRKPAHFEFFN